MTELLLSLFKLIPYGGATCAEDPKVAIAIVAAAANGGGGGTAVWSLSWLTIIPQVSLLGDSTTAAAPLWLSSIVVVVAVGTVGLFPCWTEFNDTTNSSENTWFAYGKPRLKIARLLISDAVNGK